MLTFDGIWHFGEVFSSRLASCGWAVCWCQCCGSSGPWWRWGYGMGRHMLWTTNTGAFYWWHFECTEIPWRDPEAHCCTIHPRPLPHVVAWKGTAPCCKDLYTIPGSWKHPSFSMASILTGHVTHWACLGCSGSAYKTACSSSCQYPATSHSHWRGVDQLSTGHNQQPYQLNKMCYTASGKWWSHQILTGFHTFLNILHDFHFLHTSQ